MKKPMKKLGLAKETVRSLEGTELTAVVGGGYSYYDPSCHVVCKYPTTDVC
jgi:natural product precursor